MFISKINGFSQNGYRSTQNSFALTNIQFTTLPIKFQISFEGDDYFDYDNELKKQLDKRNGWQRFWNSGKKKAKNIVNERLIGFNQSKQYLSDVKNNTIAANEKVITEMKARLADLEKLLEESKKNLEIALKNTENEKTILALQDKISKLKEARNKDAANIFKFYLDGLTNQEIDYQKLGNEVCKAIRNEEAFSSQGIINVVEYAKDNCKGSEITEDMLMDAIHKVGPNISKEDFGAFFDDISNVLNRYKINEQDV